MTDRKTIGRAAFSSPPPGAQSGVALPLENAGVDKETLALTGETSLRGPGVLAWFGTKCRSSKQRTNGRRWPRPGTASLPPSLCTPYENRQISCLLPSTKLISSQLSSSYRLAGLGWLIIVIPAPASLESNFCTNLHCMLTRAKTFVARSDSRTCREHVRLRNTPMLQARIAARPAYDHYLDRILKLYMLYPIEPQVRQDKHLANQIDLLD